MKSFSQSEQERITLYNYKHQQSHQLEGLRCNSTETNSRRKSQMNFFSFFFEVSLCPSTWNVKKWARVTVANCWWLVKYARYRAWWVLKRLPVAEMFLFRDFQKNNMHILERSQNKIWWIANWICVTFTYQLRLWRMYRVKHTTYILITHIYTNYKRTKWNGSNNTVNKKRRNLHFEIWRIIGTFKAID